MTMPFTAEEFLGVFAAYNAAIWPAQIGSFGLGLVAVTQLLRRGSRASRVILTILALMWLVNGVAYHAIFFSTINPAAWLFAAAFVAQACLFAAGAVRFGGVSFAIDRSFRTAAGLGVIGYAMLIYPVLGVLAGHGLMSGPMFGVAPCPTTIFTLGLLMLARGRWRVSLSVIPILWSLIGFAAAAQFGILEDFGLPVAGLLLTIALVSQGRSARPPARSAR